MRMAARGFMSVRRTRSDISWDELPMDEGDKQSSTLSQSGCPAGKPLFKGFSGMNWHNPVSFLYSTK